MATHNRMSSSPAYDVLVVLHFAFPIALLLAFIVAFMTHSIVTAPKDATLERAKGIYGPGGKPLPKTKKRGPSAQRELLKTDFSPAKKAVFTWLSVGVILTFVANAAVVILHALVDRKDGWWCGEHAAVYIVGSFTVFCLILISLVDTSPSPTWAHAAIWLLALAMEATLLAASFLVYTRPHREPSAIESEPGRFRSRMTEWEGIECAVDAARIMLILILLAFWFFFNWKRSRDTRAREADIAHAEETTGLLNGRRNDSKQANGRAYGGTQQNGNPSGQPLQSDEEHQDAWVRPEKNPSRGWYEYLRGYALFFPYLWPAKSRKLQMLVLACFGLVILQRAVNVLVPDQSGRITNQLTNNDGTQGVPWASISLYIVYRLLQGNQGIVGAVRNALWIPVSQYSYQELSTAAFEHVHGLSLDFHLNKKTGEVISALNKGNSINSFLENLTFSLVPMLIDMFIAVGYFLGKYDAYYALVLFIMTIVYLYITVRLSQWRSDKRREMVKLDREEGAVKNDSLVSYETVKYFNAEEREFKRYRDAVKAYQKSEYTVLFSLQALNVSQMAVFMAGLLITCFIAAYQVTRGIREVGDFVALLVYMTQLQAPLNFFGTFYRSIQSAMINAERLLELFKEQPTVTDDPNAQELVNCRGEIQCNDLEFAYDSRHPALKGTTFHCAPGTTTALVGESGGGKSTIFRLLFRYYNLTGGNIEIDGHDVRDITIDSLRRHIGVVPQDTVLFNESIMYNLKYANPGASDEQVFEACRAASIHNKILSFPDGYDSKVGERGLKLSGGEKQRVAIARTILKNPRIILLDEATAALDSETEQNIQSALRTLTQNRTTLVIAHRLSTITTADQILVLQGGMIAEAGSHTELMEKNGRYASMWKKQIRAQKAAEEARVLTDKAKRLREEFAGDDSASASQSEDERSSPVASDKPGHHKQVSSLTMVAKSDEEDSSTAGNPHRGE